ncbi:GNAT family N-acetyltransferase [Phyllobacterium phragmitis]|uniref:GNAT family N-acetyltransferase n=1 Tax=Phyllobacterium phragmitis TaxID=2670329 RepID=UPI0038B3987D
MRIRPPKCGCHGLIKQQPRSISPKNTVKSSVFACEILLNYVSPDTRFGGISKAMLGHMEAEAKAKGLACCVVESTKTAVRFYQSAGYEFDEGAEPDNLTMRKWLERNDD